MKSTSNTQAVPDEPRSAFEWLVMMVAITGYAALIYVIISGIIRVPQKIESLPTPSIVEIDKVLAKS